MSYKFSLKGDKDLSKALQDRMKKEAIEKVVLKNTTEMNRNAQRFAPVDTGALSGSILPTIRGLEGRSKAGVHYAGYVEYGTRYQSANPYMKRAFELQRPLFIREMEALIR